MVLVVAYQLWRRHLETPLESVKRAAMADRLQILLWNANGLLQRKLELDQFLINNNIDVAQITETHCTNRYSILKSGSYKIYNVFHPSGKAQGGASIYVHSRLHHSAGISFNTPAIQAATIQLKLHGVQTTLAAVYCPPNQPIACSNFMDLFQQLGPRWIAGGDFNAKNTHWGARLVTSRGRELQHAVAASRCATLSGGSPTYWPSDSAKIPDLLDFFVLRGVPKRSLHVTNLVDLSSDHSPVVLSTSNHSATALRPPSLTTRHTDWEAFRSLVECSIGLGARLKSPEELESAVQGFSNLLVESAKAATPPGSPTQPTSTVYPAFIRQLVLARRAARKKWQRTRLPADKSSFNRLNKDLSNNLKTLRNERLGEYLQSISATPGSNYSLWKATKGLTRAPTDRVPPLKTPNSTWANTEEEKVEVFAQHLATVFQPNDIPSSITPNLNFEVDGIIKHFSPKEVAAAIDKLNPKKAPGADSITARMIQELPKPGILYLTYLFNAILRLEYFPHCWKPVSYTHLTLPTIYSV